MKVDMQTVGIPASSRDGVLHYQEDKHDSIYDHSTARYLEKMLDVVFLSIGPMLDDWQES